MPYGDPSEPARPPRTLYELACEAERVQDACNLTAIVRSYAFAISDLSRILGGGTDAVRNHPITIAWADKIASLTGIQSISDRAMDAHGDVSRIIAAGPPAPGRGTDETAHYRAG